ncbi:hypothetical protein NHX12_005083 [Muraenolepis orangiensis]|uniref:PRMT5 oligomerisation domain-containing protein n=1 Tax=Muraenolepis orangiensis TaxID=630683 RepID=A0A9Q0IEC8_9TELE|nr:hypothetical protein NHX12_004544 [Muraenolepis orangiensis]KAJ3595780.1 hypothetical protein NHX12_005083 [Muraenolepis orangiensis]
MVLGAGRGPLVNAALSAAHHADRKLKIYAVEKNPNAIQPIRLSRTDDVTVHFWRCNNGKKVWYEWAVTEPSCSAIHNPAGRSYTIGL